MIKNILTFKDVVIDQLPEHVKTKANFDLIFKIF